MSGVSKEFLDSQITIKKEIKQSSLKDDSALRLQKERIPQVREPAKDSLLPFPEDVTDIPDQDLGKYLGVYEAHAAYVNYMKARREIDLSQAQKLLEYVSNKLLASYPQDMKPTDKKIQLHADQYFLQCQMDVEELLADLKLLTSSVLALQGYARAMSREISSRSSMYGAYPRGRIGGLNGDGPFQGGDDEDK